MRHVFIPIFFALLVFGCGQNNKVIKEPVHEKIVEENPDIYKRKFDEGIDFSARGNEPFWSLDIDLDKGMMFTTLTDISELNIPAVKVITKHVEDIIRYHAVAEEGELIITLVSDVCLDDMSGENFSHTVTLQAKRSVDNNYTEFKGCGKFLLDKRLHDIWVMQEMTGVELKKENLSKGLPVFEFYLNEMRFSGHAGCNQLAGKIEIEGNKITFGEIIATRMACPDMEVELVVLSALTKNTFKYAIDKLKLTLVAEDGVKMAFNKVD